MIIFSPWPARLSMKVITIEHTLLSKLALTFGFLMVHDRKVLAIASSCTASCLLLNLRGKEFRSPPPACRRRAAAASGSWGGGVREHARELLLEPEMGRRRRGQHQLAVGELLERGRRSGPPPPSATLLGSERSASHLIQVWRIMISEAN